VKRLLYLTVATCVCAAEALLAAEPPTTGSVPVHREKAADSTAARSSKKVAADEALEIVKREYPLARRIPRNSNVIDAVSGHYEGPYGWIALTGEEFYLFPDKTYFYLYWADIMPRTIYDRGTWEQRDGFVVLKTDGKAPDHRRAKNHVYLPVTMPAEQLEENPGNRKNGESRDHSSSDGPCVSRCVAEEGETFLLVGTDLSDVEKVGIRGYVRTESISSGRGKEIKDAVLRETFLR